MREGSQAEAQPTGDGDKKIEMTDEQKIHGQISMVRRLANFINVTAAELRAANEELQLMADTDELTGLSNRRVIDKLIRTAIEHAHILNFNIILGIIDIDDFKQINDTYGHTEGDKVLVKITEIAREKIEQIHGGKIGRWGGEEFLFVLPKINLDEGKKALEEIRLAIKNQYFEGIGYRTISIGITEIRANDTANDVFRRADEALYEAKGTGKNKVCVR
jgi:diguanylate cyclase (GGDEF)-like protein